MMRIPTDLERESLAHLYDPTKAHEYYMRVRKLKGRKPGQGDTSGGDRPKTQVLKTAQKKKKHVSPARAKQRQELTAAINGMQDRLRKLEELIRKRQHDEKSHDRKSKAKKERAAKERDKPKSAAEKAKASRENEKYRDKHKQELKTKAKKDGKSGGAHKKGSEKKHSVSELKSLATKVKGQIAVAKQKLAAL